VLRVRFKKAIRISLLVTIVLPFVFTILAPGTASALPSYGNALPASSTLTALKSGVLNDNKKSSNPDDWSNYPPGMRTPSGSAGDSKAKYDPFTMEGTKDAKNDANAGPSGWSWLNPFNVPGNLVKTVSKWAWSSINGIILGMLQPVYKTVMGYLSKFVFQEPGLTPDGRIASFYKYFAWVVGGVFTFLIVLVGIKTMFGVSLGYNDYRIKNALPRIVVAGFCAIFAMPLCNFFCQMAHSAAVQTLMIFQPKNATDLPLTVIWNSLTGSSNVPGLLVLLLALIMIIGFIVLLIFYLIRNAALLILTVLAPLAFAFWIDDSTSQYTTLWAEAFFALVFVEFIHALIIALTFNILTAGNSIVSKSPDPLYNILLCFGMLYLMYKIPSYIFKSSLMGWGRPQMVRGALSVSGATAIGSKVAGAVG